MKCKNCGEELGAGFLFCRSCGTPTADGDAVSEGAGSSDSCPALPTIDDIEGTERLFIDPGERLVGVLGRSFLEDFLAGKGLKRSFIAVSDKYVYHKGRAYSVKNGRRSALKIRGSAVVDLADVSAAQIVSAADIFRLVLCVILFIAAVGTGVYAFALGGGELFYLITGGLLLLSLVSLLAHLISRRRLITLYFGGGGISLDRKWFRKEEFYEFQRQLFLAKDAKKKAKDR